MMSYLGVQRQGGEGVSKLPKNSVTSYYVNSSVAELLGTVADIYFFN